MERCPSDVHLSRGAYSREILATVIHLVTLIFQLIFEAIPKSESTQARRYRGYIAIDEIKFNTGDQCKGHCTFDSGLCKFVNDQSGNFQWKVVSFQQYCQSLANFICFKGRGSNNPNTGPQRDHSSFSTNRVTGAFAFIETGHPRRPGDK